MSRLIHISENFNISIDDIRGKLNDTPLVRQMIAENNLSEDYIVEALANINRNPVTPAMLEEQNLLHLYRKLKKIIKSYKGTLADSKNFLGPLAGSKIVGHYLPAGNEFAGDITRFHDYMAKKISFLVKLKLFLDDNKKSVFFTATKNTAKYSAVKRIDNILLRLLHHLDTKGIKDDRKRSEICAVLISTILPDSDTPLSEDNVQKLIKRKKIELKLKSMYQMQSVIDNSSPEMRNFLTALMNGQPATIKVRPRIFPKK